MLLPERFRIRPVPERRSLMYADTGESGDQQFHEKHTSFLFHSIVGMVDGKPVSFEMLDNGNHASLQLRDNDLFNIGRCGKRDRVKARPPFCKEGAQLFFRYPVRNRQQKEFIRG